jgi:hypothetical protein
LRLPGPVLRASYRGSARFRTRLRLPRAVVMATSRPGTNTAAGLLQLAGGACCETYRGFPEVY